MITPTRFFMFFISICSLCTSVSSTVSADDKKDRELFRVVQEKECPEKIGELYLDGADLNACDDNGNIPLHWAVEKNFIDNTAKLLSLGSTVINEKGPTIDKKNKDEEAAFHRAVRQKNLDMVNLLCEWNADINVTNRHGKTPLRIAIDYNAPEIVNTLLNRHADVNIADNNGDTPLYAAFRDGRKKLLNDLCDRYGADITITNKQGLTPFDVASPSHPTSLLEDLLSAFHLV